MKTTRLIVIVALSMLLSLTGCKSKDKGRQLTVLCAAGLREPMVELIAVFEKEHAPATVRIDYAGSGELLGRMEASSAPEYRPDIYIAAEESYAQQARQIGLVDRCETLAYFVPVIAVARGNPRGIRTLADLGRPGIMVALGEPRGPAIGLVTDQVLKKAGLMSVRKNAGGSFTTVQAVAAQVALRNADACIIWDTIARQGDFRDKLDVVLIPDAPEVRVVICRVRHCPSPDLADEFIRLVTTSDAARESFRGHGFSVTPPTASSSAPTTSAGR